MRSTSFRESRRCIADPSYRSQSRACSAHRNCPLDTSSLHDRFAAWVTEAAGIELTDTEQQTLGVGGMLTEARQARVQLIVAGHTWDATVWFCDLWPLSFHLLGQSTLSADGKSESGMDVVVRERAEPPRQPTT